MPGSSGGERRIPPEYCEAGASGIGSVRHAIMRPVVRNSVVYVTVNILSVSMFRPGNDEIEFMRQEDVKKRF
jgi:hypothetical protein